MEKNLLSATIFNILCEQEADLCLKLAITLLLWNLIVFIVYAADKQKARQRKWRIPETVLLGLSFLAGGPGSLLGMYLLRHKTRHIKFRILVPLAALIQTVLLIIII